MQTFLTFTITKKENIFLSLEYYCIAQCYWLQNNFWVWTVKVISDDKWWMTHQLYMWNLFSNPKFYHLETSELSSTLHFFFLLIVQLAKGCHTFAADSPFPLLQTVFDVDESRHAFVINFSTKSLHLRHATFH